MFNPILLSIRRRLREKVLRLEDFIGGAGTGRAGRAVMLRGNDGRSLRVGDGGNSIMGERSEAPRATSFVRGVVTNMDAGRPALPGVCGGVTGRTLLVSMAWIVEEVVRFGRKRRDGFRMKDLVGGEGVTIAIRAESFVTVKSRSEVSMDILGVVGCIGEVSEAGLPGASSLSSIGVDGVEDETVLRSAEALLLRLSWLPIEEALTEGWTGETVGRSVMRLNWI